MKRKRKQTEHMFKKNEEINLKWMKYISDKQNLTINVTLKTKKLKRPAASKGKCAL